MKYCIIIIAAVFIVCSCNHNDKEIPTLYLESPANGTHFVKGDVIHIKGNISDNKELKQIHVHFENASGIELIHIEKILDQQSFAFDTSYTIMDTVKTGLTLELEAYDQSDNHAIQTFDLSQN